MVNGGILLPLRELGNNQAVLLPGPGGPLGGCLECVNRVSHFRGDTHYILMLPNKVTNSKDTRWTLIGPYFIIIIFGKSS